MFQYASIDPRTLGVVAYPLSLQPAVDAMYNEATTAAEAREKRFTIDLGATHLSITVHVRPDGTMFQTTGRPQFSGRVGTCAGYRDVGRFAGDSHTQVKLIRSDGDWRLAPDSVDDAYTTTVVLAPLATESERADDATAAETGFRWHYCKRTIDTVATPSGMNQLLYTTTPADWLPCSEKQHGDLEAGRQSGDTRIQSSVGLVPCTIDFVADEAGVQFAAQKVHAATSSLYAARVRLLRRQKVDAETARALEARTEAVGLSECCICMEPVYESDRAVILPCTHGDQVHSMCIRHCEEYGVIKCPVCRAEKRVDGAAAASSHGGR
jgi:hypothetical protein